KKSAATTDLSRWAASLTFSDRLVVQMWSAQFKARARQRDLLSGLRDARARCEALTSMATAMESELELARAAYDVQRDKYERRNRQATEQARGAEERITKLSTEHSDVQFQLQAAKASLAERTFECQRLSEELARRLLEQEQARHNEASTVAAAA